MINKKLALVIFFVVFLVTLYLSYSFFSANADGSALLSQIGYKPPVSNGNKTPSANESEPKTEACPLNGKLYGKSQMQKWEQRRPLGVMIENSTEARPQSGLNSADIIYEAVAEGGITRFLAIFYCNDASYVGPVRSARIYFVKLLQGYGDYPLYAHVGGANTDGPADALGEIDDIGWGLYNDLNQFAVPFPNFWRDYERLPNRVTEHTVYTNTTKLWDFAKTKRNLTNVDKKGVAWDQQFKPWTFKDDAKQGERGSADKIGFGFWDQFGADYGVTWNYDKVTNSYKRVNGGQPHLDKNTGKQIEAKNVIVIFANESPANDGYPGGHILYKLTGSGEGIVFENGKATKVTWNKKDEESQLTFFDQNGKGIDLVRGLTWVEILPIGNEVTY
ncbi:hypothetical protein A2866_02855 [Candidatus Roizmanbacteria bacterium RIFCSPHIGHO2_01_FULL_39_8]|uniref:DUF3048 domain-containing protein n=3 Tax=Candidatus Roizmaniibacteriota TaxID=1752723 RepID=A0A1F7GQJ4_9BACT|nr:MAG: hypothetical protein A2866_02855 [Candidatus Roizmanbacteria bacterium RIFCSPHIGHO2_01_FULL_39_8]OGK28563.1 MAG: hypothetical protein A3C28_05870 [Candidatus Roizmanbacteria bacterium RIFCSPHIGHO2_02_FULL_39_9]OGK37929.1 MAG: hypothetical protein A3F60_04995 [Candidatus Roizmanbacteria bacterium RIFCSPHIGHO2_12_FULL_39_8]